jgi:hypothetical protein
MNRTKKYTVELTDAQKKALREIYDKEFKINNIGDQAIADIICQIVEQNNN